MKVFLKIVVNYNLAACGNTGGKPKKESYKNSFFIVKKLFAKLKQYGELKKEVQARKSIR